MLSILVFEVGGVELTLILMVLVTTAAIILGLVYFSKRQQTANLKKCPFCAYAIPAEARVCAICRRDLPR